MVDWLGYKSPDQTEVGRVLDWSLDFWLSLDLDRDWIWDTRWFWIIVVVCLDYHLTDFTLHLWFLFTTLTFTTRFAYNE